METLLSYIKIICSSFDNNKHSNKKKMIKVLYSLKRKFNNDLNEKEFDGIIEDFAKTKPIKFLLLMNEFKDHEVL